MNNLLKNLTVDSRYVEEAKVVPSIKMTDIDLRIKKDTALIVEIDIFRFMKERELSYVVVEMNTQGEYECLEEIMVAVEMNESNLEKLALNWIFKHVELVDEGEL